MNDPKRIRTTKILEGADVAAFGLIPQPVSIEVVDDPSFELTAQTEIGYTDASLKRLAFYLARSLSTPTGFLFSPVFIVERDYSTASIILLSKDTSIFPSDEDRSTLRYKEGYVLHITTDKVTITSCEPAGAFYGIQTVLQLFSPNIYRQAPTLKPQQSTSTSASTSTSTSNPWQLPCVHITDYPRFVWRGLHLDVCRHFLPKEFLFKYINLIALHKLNIFHLHLTEDQGWRFESKKYPLLTSIGAWRKETVVGKSSKHFDKEPHGGFYTQEDLRELVAYAEERFVTIVPEIEMPGHSQAAIAAYPELGNMDVIQEPVEVWTRWGVSQTIYNVEETTIQFLQNILEEVMDIFPSKYIHVGGDEAVKDQWKQSPRVQERMKELGVQDEHELQSWFIRRMDQFLISKGRRLIGWDEILEGGLAEEATVMSWRGVTGGIKAAKAQHDVVMCPCENLYFDYYQADPATEPLAIGSKVLPLKKVWEYNPVPNKLRSEDERKRVLGAQGQVWTEYIPNSKKVEYMAYPRACALAEVVWLGEKRFEGGGWTSFLARLEVHKQRLSVLDVNYWNKKIESDS
jgi:hexosaminidase